MPLIHLSDAALSALSDLLDVNDEDDYLVESGLDPMGLDQLRAAVAGFGGRPLLPLFTLGEHMDNPPTFRAPIDSWWNGMPVPRITPRVFADHLSDLQSVDPDGIYDATGVYTNEAETLCTLYDFTTDEETNYPMEGGTFAPNGLAWAIVDES